MLFKADSYRCKMYNFILLRLKTLKCIKEGSEVYSMKYSRSSDRAFTTNHQKYFTSIEWRVFHGADSI